MCVYITCEADILILMLNHQDWRFQCTKYTIYMHSWKAEFWYRFCTIIIHNSRCFVYFYWYKHIFLAYLSRRFMWPSQLAELFWSKYIHCCRCCRQHPNFSSFFSRTMEPISNIQSSKHPWMEGLQIHSLF